MMREGGVGVGECIEKYICEKTYIVGGTLMLQDAFLLVDFVVKLQQNSTCKQKKKK